MGSKQRYKTAKRNKTAKSAKLRHQTVKDLQSKENPEVDINQELGEVPTNYENSEETMEQNDTNSTPKGPKKPEHLSTPKRSRIEARSCTPVSCRNRNRFDLGQLEFRRIFADNDLYLAKENQQNKNALLPSNLTGYRIVEIQHVFDWSMKLQAEHAKICTAGNLKWVKEIHEGLKSNFVFECSSCKRTETRTSENSKPGVNENAVWGAVTSGSGHTQISSVLAVLNIPPISYKRYQRIETELEHVWSSHLTDEMKKAGEEERRLAVEAGDVDKDGVPYITVICDGGWSKRSYGHNYNAPSGVAAIIGYRTKKLVFVGIRNKFCYKCVLDSKKTEAQRSDHQCYRNWDGSSSAMEADIIVEGFKCSETMHGLRYNRFIADGDSSVHSKIMEKVSYGFKVTKLECANHCVKCYTGSLHKITLDTKYSYDARVRILKPQIKRLTIAARSAIGHVSRTNGNAEDLRRDLANGPLHVFGQHDNCREYFCKYRRGEKIQTEEEKEKSKAKLAKLKESGAYPQMMAVLDRVKSKADRLFLNETSNRAELFMSQIAKFIGGKRINYSQKGGWNRRVYVSGLSYQKGDASFHRSPYKRFSAGKSPGIYFKRHIERSRKRNVATSKRLFAKPAHKVLQTKSKLPPINTDYGPLAEQPPLTQEQLKVAGESHLKSLQVTKEQRDNIENQSRGQHGNPIYDGNKHHRLTASNFGKVVKRMTKTSCHALVKQLLYKTVFSTPSTEYGKKNESVAFHRFQMEYKKEARNSGLFIDLENGFLGASPDGVLDAENAIVEIKTAPSARNENKGTKLQDHALKTKNFCLQIVNDQLKLKRNHDYFFQVQGQLNITGKQKCYFILFVDEDTELHVEEIEKDENMWNEVMLPKLKSFYLDCILPEVIDPQVPRGKRCRDPDYIVRAQEQASVKSTKRKNAVEDSGRKKLKK